MVRVSMHSQSLQSTGLIQEESRHKATDRRNGFLILYKHYRQEDVTSSMGRRTFKCRWKLSLVIFVVVLYLGVFNLITHSQLSKPNTWDPGGGGYVYYPNGAPKGTRFNRLAKVRGWSCKKIRLSDRPFPLTSLVSYPGSGNTWVRHLIQQATGWVTGSVYRDYALKLYSFPGEGIKNSSAIAVKTHEWGPRAQALFQKCILLVREPFGALLAEYNRRHAGHRGRATPNNFGRAWRDFVYSRSREWQEMVFDWLTFPRELYILRYEKLKTDLSGEMRQVLQFLSVNVTAPDFNCMLKNSEGLFHRTVPEVNPLDFYDADMKLKISALWENITKALDQRSEKKIHFDSIQIIPSVVKL